MNRRLLATLAAAAFAVTGSAGLAAAHEGPEVCEISVHDHTPGTYPGGTHIHNSCFAIHLPALPDLV
jgi:hypothetical protein